MASLRAEGASVVIAVLSSAMLLAAVVYPARAENFTQFFAFGGSNQDTGWFANDSTGIPFIDAKIAQAVALGGEAKSTGPGLGNAEIFAARFGLDARPANTPGGTNFAISGAFNEFGPNASLFQNVFPNAALPGTAKQIHNYLASVGGVANPNALYVVSSGSNNVTAAIGAFGNAPAAYAYLDGQALLLANAISDLQNAGARTIVVSNIYFSLSTDPVQRAQLAAIYDATWANLENLGVNFVPADLDAALLSVSQNLGAYGFTVPITSQACTPPPFTPSGYGAWCAPVFAPNGVTGYMVSPAATQTHLSLDNVHITAAGQQIQADYYYNLVVAPSQISMLAETPIRARAERMRSLQQHLATSAQTGDPYEIWATGDASDLDFENDRGFSGATGSAVGVSLGISRKLDDGFVVGAAVTFGQQQSDFEFGGHFRQDEIAASLFAAFRSECLWGDAIATYGALGIETDRDADIGITTQHNASSTDGSNASLALRAGCDFGDGSFAHGPFAGLLLQHTTIDGFTENGSYTSLAFEDQTRNSALARLGYSVRVAAGVVAPFAQIEWVHDLVDDERVIIASLTTISAPSYEMAAISVERDRGSATVGARLDLGGSVIAIAAVNANVDTQATRFAGGIGLHYALQRPH